MKRHYRAPLAALACALLSASAPAELKLSLTVEGTPAELAHVLEVLRAEGLAGADKDEKGMWLQVFSTAGEGAATEDAPQAPVPTLVEPAASPGSTPPGAPVLLTVTVTDPEHRVDTIAAWLRDTSVTLDLHDNGQDGDAVAGDGIWSATLSVPQATPAGLYTLTFSAYDAKGDPIQVPGSEGATVPLTGTAGLAVTG